MRGVAEGAGVAYMGNLCGCWATMPRAHPIQPITPSTGFWWTECGFTAQSGRHACSIPERLLAFVFTHAASPWGAATASPADILWAHSCWAK